MTTGVVDSTVIIHLLRNNLHANEWVNTLTSQLSVTSITWLEVMFGAPGKRGQAHAKIVLSQFVLMPLNGDDQRWAMEQMERYRLSDGVGIMDCLIASVCHRQNVPIYTHNRKDYLKILPERLVITPY